MPLMAQIILRDTHLSHTRTLTQNDIAPFVFCPSAWFRNSPGTALIDSHIERLQVQRRKGKRSLRICNEQCQRFDSLFIPWNVGGERAGRGMGEGEEGGGGGGCRKFQFCVRQSYENQGSVERTPWPSLTIRFTLKKITYLVFSIINNTLLRINIPLLIIFSILFIKRSIKLSRWDAALHCGH